MALMGNKNEESTAESSSVKDEESNAESSQTPKSSEQSPEAENASGAHKPSQDLSTIEEKEEVQNDGSPFSATEQTAAEEGNEAVSVEKADELPETAEVNNAGVSEPDKAESVSPLVPVEPPESPIMNLESSDSFGNLEKGDVSEVEPLNNLESVQAKSKEIEVDQIEGPFVVPDDSHNDQLHENIHEQKMQVESTDEEKTQAEETVERMSPVQAEASTDSTMVDTNEATDLHSVTTKEADSASESSKSPSPSAPPSNEATEMVSEGVFNGSDAIVKAIEVDQLVNDTEIDIKERDLSSGSNASDTSHSVLELEKLKMEMKMMESALQGAARQAQVCGEMILDHLI